MAITRKAQRTRRKTTAEIRADATMVAREDMLAEVCRFLKNDLNMQHVGDAIWELYASKDRKCVPLNVKPLTVGEACTLTFARTTWPL